MERQKAEIRKQKVDDTHFCFLLSAF